MTEQKPLWCWFSPSSSSSSSSCVRPHPPQPSLPLAPGLCRRIPGKAPAEAALFSRTTFSACTMAPSGSSSMQQRRRQQQQPSSWGQTACYAAPAPLIIPGA
ncbi:unnamed protein product [Pleuronectes platessa]|uniref:Uncharacterized protein n=1 Tax=Pleuronectes platessa TaxID=8262 RepID=A0A9N7W0U1_PLEPL|nr:unnamed protein product [Pleuronectes platessa]